MARRKNTKRIDPRYFLNETTYRDEIESAINEVELAPAMYNALKAKGQLPPGAKMKGAQQAQPQAAQGGGQQGPHFDPATGEPLTDKGRALETKMVEQAIEAENKCLEWAKADQAMKMEIIKHHRSGKPGMSPVVMQKCPHKASDEAHRRLDKVRDRNTRQDKGQAPAKDDTSQIAKVRRQRVAKTGTAAVTQKPQE